MKQKWIIQDWAGNYPTFNLKKKLYFISFDDAEDFLCGFLGDQYEIDRGEYYIIQVKEN